MERTRGARSSATLDDVIRKLPEIVGEHAPGTASYEHLRDVTRVEVHRLFSPQASGPVHLDQIGLLELPFHRMGAIASPDLLVLEELIIFAFYITNRGAYDSAVDIGANIGLHSIVLDRLGFDVDAYEPDPYHHSVLCRNIALNDCHRISVHNQAVSCRTGVMDFVRVVNNTTANHIVGSRPNAYGPLEQFKVDTVAFDQILTAGRLIKIDAEGHERELLLSTHPDQWATTDALVEVFDSTNAGAIFRHFEGSGVNLFAQRVGWARVHSEHQMPRGWRDGVVFVSTKEAMPWLPPR